MKFSITLSLLLFSLLTFGQDLTEIKSSLEKIKIDENGSYKSDLGTKIGVKNGGFDFQVSHIGH